MSAATAEKSKAAEPVVSDAEARHIVHPQDMALLQHYGADITERAFIDEYFEYRDIWKRPGLMDSATLHELTIRQKRRQAKKDK